MENKQGVNMEKKKLLLVAISVGVFLVLAIGAAILVFTPKNASTASLAAASRPVQGIDTGINVPAPTAGTGSNGQDAQQPSSIDPVDLVRRPEDVPGLQTPPEGASRQNGEYYVGSQSPEALISVPKPSTAAVPDTPPAGRAAPASAPVQRTQASTPVSAPAQRAPTPASSTQTQAKPAAQTKTVNNYWVQTGAFSTVLKAEGVKETLASKGITSIIENQEVDGRTLFRVRVGPYTSQNEANYWLSLIKTINGFEDSQVRQTQTRQ